MSADFREITPESHYTARTDEVARSLWAVSASNERVNSWAGQVLINTASVPSPAPGLTELAGRFRACANLGTNTRVRNNPTEGHYCFPNFHQADYGQGIVYGCVTVRTAHFTHADVLAEDMGGPTNERPNGVEQRIRNANAFAWQMNYGAALPTFYHVGSGNGLRYGVVLFPQSVLETRFLVARTLPTNPDSIEEWFRAANDYAIANGYSAGFPTGKRRISAAETFTYPMMLCALLRPGVASSYACSYSIASVLGSTYDFSPLIAKVGYLSIELPPLGDPNDAIGGIPIPH